MEREDFPTTQKNSDGEDEGWDNRDILYRGTLGLKHSPSSSPP